MPPSLGADAVRHQGVAACICLHRNPPAFLPYISLELNQYIRLKTSEAPTSTDLCLPEFLQLLLTQDSALQQEVNVGIMQPALQTDKQCSE